MSRLGPAVLALSAAFDRLCLGLAKAALLGMVAVILLQVVARYLLRQPPGWTEELARYLMVWGGLPGATLAFRRAADPAVVRPGETGPGPRARAARIAIALSAVIFVGPILYFSLFGAGMDPGRSFLMQMSARTSPGLGLNMAFVAAAIPTACAVILIHLAARLIGGPLPQPRPEV